MNAADLEAISSGCQIWPLNRNAKGYGRIWHEGRMVLVHRLVYEWVYGAIPEGALILHRCNTPSCINPEHLYAGTLSDNAYDAIRAGKWRNQNIVKTHCKRGHVLTGDNVYLIYKDGEYVAGSA